MRRAAALCAGALAALWAAAPGVGSDWPVLRLAGDYAGWRLAHDLLTSLDPAPTALDRDAVFGGNAAQLYRLTL